jgi:hypothetical protein
MSIKDGGKINLIFILKANVKIEENFSISEIPNESKMQIEEDNVNY